MWPFRRQLDTTDPRAAAKPADVVETACQQVADREAEAHARVVELKGELASLDDEMLHFKTQYRVTTNRFGTLLRVECGMAQRSRVETEWRELLSRRDKIVAQWHSALHTWSDLKGQTT